jgi:hypothetical protein
MRRRRTTAKGPLWATVITVNPAELRKTQCCLRLRALKRKPLPFDAVKLGRRSQRQADV